MLANEKSIVKNRMGPLGLRQEQRWYYFTRLRWRAPSNSSRDILVVRNNSCLAPLESAIAFHPVWVGVVIRTFTCPLASRTFRIRPGMIVPIDE